MALVALDGSPLVAIGQPFITNSLLALPASNATLQDAAKEACIMHGHIVTDDGASHTINTTGSSALEWLAGTVTFVNAASTFNVGLATMDTATGPPARATNSTDVITFSVSRSMTGGGGGITASAWNSHVPTTGTLTVANGDLIAFATQMTTVGGVDAVNTQTGDGVALGPRPGVTNFTGASYSAASQVPNAVITFSDGHLGWFYGGAVFRTATTTQTWNNSSGTKEYGNLIQFPFPLKIYGITACCGFIGNADVILYSNPLGTPVAERTVSVDLNVINSSGARYSQILFPSPYTAIASAPVAAIIKPTSATNVTMPYKSFNVSAHQATEPCGANGYAISRASGAFAAVNANKDRFAIGVLVGAFEHGVMPTYGPGII